MDSNSEYKESHDINCGILNYSQGGKTNEVSLVMRFKSVTTFYLLPNMFVQFLTKMFSYIHTHRQVTI